MYAAILAGGVGTRLWPRSRQANPKQFADITGSGRTMIQATVDRLAGLVPGARVCVVTGEAYRTLATGQLPEVAPEQILAEPGGRNTAPAIGLACIHLRRRRLQRALLSTDFVVIGQRPKIDAVRLRTRRQFLRRERAIGGGGVAVQVGVLRESHRFILRLALKPVPPASRAVVP